MGRNPHVDAGDRLIERKRIDTRILQSLPTHFQQDALLRIHSGRFAGRDSEMPRVEEIYALQQGRPEGRCRQGFALQRFEEAPFDSIPHRGPLLLEKPPIALNAILSAGDATPYSNNGNRLSPGIFQLLYAYLRAIESKQRLLQGR